MEKQWGGTAMPAPEDIPETLKKYTEKQIEEDVMLSALRDKAIGPRRHTEIIAHVLHAAEQAYAQELGDFSVPDWDKSGSRHKVQVIDHIAYVHSHPNATVEELYKAWHEDASSSEWSKLSHEERFKYDLFRRVVKVFGQI